MSGRHVAKSSSERSIAIGILSVGSLVVLGSLLGGIWVVRAGAVVALVMAVAAVSVGVYRGTPLLDLEYAEDSEAETDMNIVMNDGGAFIEIQGTAEGHAFRHEEMQAMLALADKGIREIMQVQKQALGL